METGVMGQWGTWGNSIKGVWVQGYRPHGYWGHRWYGLWAMGTGVWATWAMGTHGAVGYRVWGTVGISHMGNGAHGAIGYRGYG